MELPDALDNLSNEYEKRQVSLSGLFSTTLRDVTPTQSWHVLGQVYMGHRLDRHYYGLFGFLAASEEDVKAHSKKPQSDIRILRALKWLKDNNHLYRDFYANFETMYRYQPQSVLVNPSLLDQQQISLQDLLQQEAIGMIFPSSSEYFDQFPAIHSTSSSSLWCTTEKTFLSQTFSLTFIHFCLADGTTAALRTSQTILRCGYLM